MLHWLANSDFSSFVKESAWGWPVALTVHAFGNATVAGLMFIIGMRLFGLFKSIPYTSLNYLFRFVWVGIVFQAMSGFTLWMSKPDLYVTDGAFDAKFSLVITGIIVTIYFQQYLKRHATEWEAAGHTSGAGLKFAAAVCTVWTFVIITGRLTAYLGSLYGV